VLHQLRLNFKSKSNNPKSKIEIELGAIHEAQGAIPLMPSAKDAMNGTRLKRTWQLLM